MPTSSDIEFLHLCRKAYPDACVFPLSLDLRAGFIFLVVSPAFKGMEDHYDRWLPFRDLYRDSLPDNTHHLVEEGLSVLLTPEEYKQDRMIWDMAIDKSAEICLVYPDKNPCRFFLQQEDANAAGNMRRVADGAMFPNGQCAVCWTTGPSPVEVYDSPGAIMEFVSHACCTEIVWIDSRGPDIKEDIARLAAWTKELEKAEEGGLVQMRCVRKI